MAWTQTDVARLKKAISSGLKQVMEGGRMVTYNSVDEQLRVLALMEAEVNGTVRQLVEQVAFTRGDE